MRQVSTILEFSTRWQGFVEITHEVIDRFTEEKSRDGLLTLFCPHTLASLLIQENAAPGVRSYLKAYFARIAPDNPSAYVYEDVDSMPAHVRTALTQVHPIIDGRLPLDTWQGIYLLEHLRRPHRPTIHRSASAQRISAVARQAAL